MRGSLAFIGLLLGVIGSMIGAFDATRVSSEELSGVALWLVAIGFLLIAVGK